MPHVGRGCVLVATVQLKLRGSTDANAAEVILANAKLRDGSIDLGHESMSMLVSRLHVNQNGELCGHGDSY
jgi:hypothetical protein